MRDAAGLTYLHADRVPAGRGSTALTTNASGTTLDDHGYYAYGKDRRGSELHTTQRFTGQQGDATGLLYYGARYYDPQLGQFISPDTLVPDAGNLFDYNRYMYARGNPMKYNDPSGHGACDGVAEQLCQGEAEVPMLETNGMGGNEIEAQTQGMRGGSLPQAQVNPSNNGGFLNWVKNFLGFGEEEPSQTNSSDVVSSGVSTPAPSVKGNPVEVEVSKTKYPQSAQHILDAQNEGQPQDLKINRSGAAGNRKESLDGIPTLHGMDRDEYPPAMFEEGGEGASVRYVTPSDNRGAGACIGAQCRILPDGTWVKIVVK